MHETEAEVIALLRRYRRKALSRDATYVGIIDLLARPIGNVFRLKYGIVDQPTLEDLFQEFMLRFCKIEETYDVERQDPAPLMPFLFAIARNLKIDHYRRQARRQSNEACLKISNPNNAPWASEIEQTLALEDMLKPLSEDDRELLILYFGYGYTMRELSEVLTHTPSTIQGRIRSARAKLAKQCSKELTSKRQRSSHLEHQQTDGEVL